MPACLLCGKQQNLPYTCNYCGGRFCSEHRLPESHDCDGVELRIPSGKRFESKFDESVNRKPTSGRRPRPIDPQTVGTRPKPDYPRSPPVKLRADAGAETGKRIVDSKTKQHLRKLFLIALVVAVVAAIASGSLPIDLPQGLDGEFELPAGNVATNQTPGAAIETQASGPTHAPYSNANERKVEVLIHREVNVRRGEQGLSELDHDSELRGIARKHSEVMAAQRDIFHTQPDGDDLSDRYSQGGNSCRVPVDGNSYSTGGENVAKTWYKEDVMADGGTVHHSTPQQLAAGVVDQWMNSPGHRENILKDYWRNEGIGVNITEERGKLAVYVTQDFC